MYNDLSKKFEGEFKNIMCCNLQNVIYLFITLSHYHSYMSTENIVQELKDAGIEVSITNISSTELGDVLENSGRCTNGWSRSSSCSNSQGNYEVSDLSD